MSHVLLILEIDTIGPFDVTSWEAASDDDVVHKTDVDRVVDGVTCRWRCVVVPRSRSENPLLVALQLVNPDAGLSHPDIVRRRAVDDFASIAQSIGDELLARR